MKQFSFFCFLGLFTSVYTWSKGDNLIKLSPTATIAPVPEHYQSTLGVVHGVKFCGGRAEVVDWRYESCTNGSNVCQIPSDGKSRKSEFSFRPSESISNGLSVQFNITADGVPSRFYDISVPDSAVSGGRVYLLKHSGSPTSEFQGKTMAFRYTVLRQVDNSVEACAEADFQNV